MSMKFDQEKPEAYHWRVHTEKRVDRLEEDNMSHEVDIAVVKAHFATKQDIAELKVLIAEAKSSILTWVVSSIFIAQLLPALLKLFITG